MKKLPLIIPFIFLMACSSADKEEQTNLLNEVMAVHDEVMPEMGKISKFMKMAQAQSETLFADSLKANDEQAMAMENLAIELDSANESMMAWMRGFNNDFEGMEHEEVMNYLKDQKSAVEEVKRKMQGVLEKAEAALKE